MFWSFWFVSHSVHLTAFRLSLLSSRTFWWWCTCRVWSRPNSPSMRSWLSPRLPTHPTLGKYNTRDSISDSTPPPPPYVAYGILTLHTPLSAPRMSQILDFRDSDLPPPPFYKVFTPRMSQCLIVRTASYHPHLAMHHAGLVHRTTSATVTLSHSVICIKVPYLGLDHHDSDKTSDTQPLLCQRGFHITDCFSDTHPSTLPSTPGLFCTRAFASDWHPLVIFLQSDGNQCKSWCQITASFAPCEGDCIKTMTMTLGQYHETGASQIFQEVEWLRDICFGDRHYC